MEGVSGVDVSWLHHSQKAVNGVKNDLTHRALPATPTDVQSYAKLDDSDGSEKRHHHLPLLHLHKSNEDITQPFPSPKTDRKTTPSLSRKSSWLSSLSSKFSSSQGTAPPATPDKQDVVNGTTSLAPATPIQATTQKTENNVPAAASPKSSPGFLTNALRRLSSSSGGMGKASGNGAMLPRRVMNVDPYRERCSISEVLPAKLRRVSFCVDVEIAGYSAPPEDDDVPPATPSKLPFASSDKQVNAKKGHDKVRAKDKAEGEALKHPKATEDVKNASDAFQAIGIAISTPPDNSSAKADELEKPPMTRKKEKKKRSEEERKERKEKKHQVAIANGVIPLELVRDGSSSESPSGSSTPVRPQDRPTTDPLRIYRRCCQLRETPAVRRILEQLAAPGANDELHPGTITCLYLSGGRFQLSDIITLGDFLAVVPVRKLVMSDCGLTDEAIRVILAGLLAVKTPAQAKYNRELPRTPEKTMPSSTDKLERLGVIEKICFKNNPQIGPDGWRHIACFIHMSRTLKAIDLSQIPFPSKMNHQIQPRPQHQRRHSQAAKPQPAFSVDVASIFEKCLRERRGAQLEELIIAECALETDVVVKIINAVKDCGITRLGLAKNNLTMESIQALAEYLKTSQCEGLDLGGNHLDEDSLQVLIDVFEEYRPKFCALSLADTGLTPTLVKDLLPVLSQLPDFRFIDFSHNRELFSATFNALSLFRRWLPKMLNLKRINLNDVGMQAEHCISLAEILPEIPLLAHICILENPALTSLASASDESSREESCALYASLLSAARVSTTLVGVDIDIPTAAAGEIVNALAKQLVAYTLRNLDRQLATTNDTVYEEKAIHYPDTILHLIGYDENTGDIENDAAPDDDYIVGGTGVAKALTVCLNNKLARDQRHITPSGSGTATPTQPAQNEPRSKAMSVNLLSNARKIQARLQPAISKEETNGDEMALRRLRTLDSMLAGIIKRFEDEYPETRLEQDTQPPEKPFVPDTAFKNPFDVDQDLEAENEEDDDPQSTALHVPGRLSRHGSEVGIHSRNLAQEEGNMHRFGQKLRRDILRPQTEDHHWGTTGLEQEPDHILALRAKLEQLSGEEIQDEIRKNGMDNVIQAIGEDAEKYKHLSSADPIAWQQLKTAHANAYSKANVSGQREAGEEAIE